MALHTLKSIIGLRKRWLGSSYNYIKIMKLL
ncbi:hypothetical protein NC652_031280 [Populus alba x Populus x berolinensis]|nr:hypothetical protein NC652_031278 [Populus alba x Populus x berolinensis]KAJ6884235.1 hypothetical protein NC652_031280 [Populus alba x Populus x berolinensis]